MSNEAIFTKKVVSTIIKSWKRTNEAAILAVISQFITRISNERPIIDVHVETQADEIASRLRGLDVVIIRRTPSRHLLHRIQRRIGIYTAASGLCAAVRIRGAADVRSLLSGDALWSGDFIIYPEPNQPLTISQDPHVEHGNIANNVKWHLTQETGASSWILSARTLAELDRLAATIVEVFAQNGVAANIC